MAAAKKKTKTTTGSMRDSIASIQNWMHTAIEMGMSLILALVVIDVLFPGTTGVVNNLGAIVGQFSKEGIAGLVALLLFLLVFRGHHGHEKE